MSNEVTNYQCPSCTGPLHFEEASGKLTCDYCGSSFAVAEVEALYAEKNARAEEAAETAAEDSGWGEDEAHMRAYSCPSCGAELICEETTAATACPYCGNPTIIPGQFGGTKKPDYIIPFRLKKDEAVQALRRHYKGKLLLPRGFASENHLREIKGIYVPFWLFDANVEAEARFSATRSRIHRTSHEEIITTDHFLVDRSGTVRFERIPADGASKMPDHYMDAIEPFSYEELKPFSMAYLPGFFADKYDVPADQCRQRAESRCRSSTIRAMEDSVRGYESRTLRSADVRMDMGEVKYALLPVWMLTTKWKDREYLFAMNGQSGKIAGQLPISWGKCAAWFSGIYAACAAILALCLL